ncbi:MAG: hypothetical protein RMJ44_01690 [Cytophagales bacterium]|nr:hypothetical protein [Bernardetiaceae bacterium]MDW8209774.1 hypothetical protein [Cytophagales bacterium]
MILIAVKISLFLATYVILFLILRKGARSAAYPSTLRRYESKVNKTLNHCDQEGVWPEDFPKLDLPPGVYILPPGAPDPSQRREHVR